MSTEELENRPGICGIFCEKRGYIVEGLAKNIIRLWKI